ncbi:MAG: hotdog fold thioesterase [Micrococcales bacterium]|nr:hotdog fold thioesterase [Micrococcales bacterium]
MQVTLGELDQKLGLEVQEQSVARVVARMPVAGNRQAFGRLHGGASLALGEFLGSWAACLHAAELGKVAVGVDVNATHHRPARQGSVTGVATPLHLGARTTSHEIVISDDSGLRVSTVRVTNLLIEPEQP